MGGEAKTSSFFFPYDPHSPGSVAVREVRLNANLSSAKNVIAALLDTGFSKEKILYIAHKTTPDLSADTLEDLYQKAVERA